MGMGTRFKKIRVGGEKGNVDALSASVAVESILRDQPLRPLKRGGKGKKNHYREHAHERPFPGEEERDGLL